MSHHHIRDGIENAFINKQQGKLFTDEASGNGNFVTNGVKQGLINHAHNSAFNNQVTGQHNSGQGVGDSIKHGVVQSAEHKLFGSGGHGVIRSGVEQGLMNKINHHI